MIAALLTLQAFPTMVEGCTMAIYLAATSTDAVIMFGWLIVIVFLLRYLNRVADRKASVLRVQILLK